MPCSASYGLNLTYKWVIMNKYRMRNWFLIVFTTIDTIYWIIVIGVFIGCNLQNVTFCNVIRLF